MIDLMNEELMEIRAKQNGNSVELTKAVEATRQWLRWFMYMDVIKEVTDGEILMVIHHKIQLGILCPRYEMHPETKKAYEERQKKALDEQNAKVLKNKDAFLKLPLDVQLLVGKPLWRNW